MKNKNGTLKLRIYPSLFVLIEITMNELEYVHSWGCIFLKYFSQQKSTNIRLLLLPKQWGGGGGGGKCDHSNETLDENILIVVLRVNENTKRDHSN